MRLFFLLLLCCSAFWGARAQGGFRLMPVDSKVFPLSPGQRREAFPLTKTPFLAGGTTFQLWDPDRGLIITYDWKTQLRLSAEMAPATFHPAGAQDSLLFDPYRLLSYRMATDGKRELEVFDYQENKLATIPLWPEDAPQLCLIRPEGLVFQVYPGDSTVFPRHLGFRIYDLQQEDPFFRNEGFATRPSSGAYRPYRELGSYLRQVTGLSAPYLAVLVAPQTGFHGSLVRWMAVESASAPAQYSARYVLCGPFSKAIIAANGASGRPDVLADTTTGYLYRGKPAITCPHLVVIHGTEVTHLVRLQTATDLEQLPLLLASFRGTAPSSLLDFSRIE